MELKKYNLHDVCEIIPGYAFKSNDFGQGDYIAIKITDIHPPTIELRNATNVCVKPKDARTQIHKGDFVMAMTGATIGKVGLMESEVDNVFINQRVCKFIPKEGFDKSYLYYVLLQPKFRKFIFANIDSSSAQPNIGHPTIYRFEHCFPNVETQRNIASVLSSLDSKISLNRAINRNLEALAKQFYDYWFVQFDFPDENGKPYKSSGGKMVWNEVLKREVPEGWEVKSIGDVAEVYNGATPSTEDEQNYGGDIVWITPKDLSNQQEKFVYQGERNISQKGYDSCSTHLLPLNTILMSSRAPIGLLAIAKSKLCTNQGFKSFVPKNKSMSTYLYYYLQMHKKQVEQLGTGTTFKEVSRDDIMGFNIIVPENKILEKWEEILLPINNKQLELQKETLSLIRQRDELLPLLMNGQVEVGN